jgi:hypothetical protein
VPEPGTVQFVAALGAAILGHRRLDMLAKEKANATANAVEVSERG